MIKCACGDAKCQIALRPEDLYRMMIIDKDGKDHLMYLDANGIVQLIRMGKRMINAQINSKTEE